MNKFNKFDDIEHLPLRAYNRAVFFCNLYEDRGKAYAEDYLLQFDVADRLKMANILSAIKSYGHKRVKEIVTQGIEFPEYPSVEEVELVVKEVA